MGCAVVYDAFLAILKSLNSNVGRPSDLIDAGYVPAFLTQFLGPRNSPDLFGRRTTTNY